MADKDLDTLVWADVPMPGGSGPVRLARLSAAAGEFRAYVRFPPGWSRPGPGHYEVVEEFIVLAGAVLLNGKRHGPESHVRVEAGEVRTGMECPDGALVVVYFGGMPRWVEGKGDLAIPRTRPA